MSGPAIHRTFEELPVWVDGDDPEFGVDFDAYATALFAETHQGLRRTASAGGEGFGAAGGLVAYRNDDLRSLMAHPALTNTPAPLLGAPFFEETPGGAEHGFLKCFAHSVFTKTPPEHGPSKKLFAKQLTAGSMGRYRDHARALVGAKLEALADQDEVDLRSDFAEPVVAEFWSEVLGLTVDEVEHVSSLAVRLQAANYFNSTEAGRADINRAGERFFEEFNALLRREIDAGQNAFLRDLRADFESIDGTGRPDSLEAHFGVSLVDGLHTLPAEIVSVAYALTASPASLARVRADPSLVTDAYYEAVRLHPGVTVTQRYALDEFEFDGLTIPSGSVIMMLWLLGNRDPEVFNAPNEFRLGRNHRPDTTFGGGSYICPGRNIVKMLCEVTLEELIRPGVDLAFTAQPRWAPASAIHEPIAAPARILIGGAR